MNANKPCLGVGIIGCGLIGQKRAAALGQGGRLIACTDQHLARAQQLADKTGACVVADAHALCIHPDIDLVIISTLHDSLASLTQLAMEAGKHVLVEKPAARSAEEIKPLLALAQQRSVKVRVGFNHRYHRALRQAKILVEQGLLGPLMFIRARYGHGARVGYEKEWRANPALSGGGELIDQGPHLIDLSRWFLGEFTQIQGHAHTFYWEMPVDDNGFLVLKTASQQTAFLHVSCTEWKNLFSMEIYGRLGKLEISGLGGSYGVERLTHYKLLSQMGPPETFAWEYPMADDSWAVELSEFYDDIHLNRTPAATLQDAYEALKIIHTIYKESGYDYSA